MPGRRAGRLLEFGVVEPDGSLSGSLSGSPSPAGRGLTSPLCTEDTHFDILTFWDQFECDFRPIADEALLGCFQCLEAGSFQIPRPMFGPGRTREPPYRVSKYILLPHC